MTTATSVVCMSQDAAATAEARDRLSTLSGLHAWFATASVEHVLLLRCILAASGSLPWLIGYLITLTDAQVQVDAPVVRPEAAHRAPVRGGGRADGAVHRHPVAAVLALEQAPGAVQHGGGEHRCTWHSAPGIALQGHTGRGRILSKAAALPVSHALFCTGSILHSAVHDAAGIVAH